MTCPRTKAGKWESRHLIPSARLLEGPSPASSTGPKHPVKVPQRLLGCMRDGPEVGLQAPEHLRHIELKYFHSFSTVPPLWDSFGGGRRVLIAQTQTFATTSEVVKFSFLT